jgi:hypothetical protein
MGFSPILGTPEHMSTTPNVPFGPTSPSSKRCRSPKLLPVPLQVRVGIATGLIVVGDLIGVGAAQEQAVVGERPNVAAGLLGLAKSGSVVIASSTHEQIGSPFEYPNLGIAENVFAWQVLGTSAAESRFEAFQSTALTPLVGRDEEVELLMRRWQQPKGSGFGGAHLWGARHRKSRIAEAVLEQLGPEPLPVCATSAHPTIRISRGLGTPLGRQVGRPKLSAELTKLRVSSN